jgi:hypothetical protein
MPAAMAKDRAAGAASLPQRHPDQWDTAQPSRIPRP